MSRMKEKFDRADFGRCPKLSCDYPLVPIAVTPHKSAKTYCYACRELYRPQCAWKTPSADIGVPFAPAFMLEYPALRARFMTDVGAEESSESAAEPASDSA
jgi:hypothetical protein